MAPESSKLDEEDHQHQDLVPRRIPLAAEPRPLMDVYEKLAHPLALGVFALTLFLPVVVGFLTTRRTRSQSDFFVGGRAMHPFVVALSAVSSGRSSWLVLGLSGVAYTRGASAVWAVVGYTTVELVQCLVLGPRLRDATRAMLRHAGTAPEAILGGIDALKFRSSMTLFAAADPDEPLFPAALAAFYGGAPDPATLRLLGRG